MDKGAKYWIDFDGFDLNDPIFLAKVKQGISNFTKILTGKDIPIEYPLSGESMTDGNTIYISSNITPKNVDSVVGLALHEASHILLTDFGYLNRERGKLLEVRYNVAQDDIENVFTLINFIEDKRIDNFIYTTSPGYQYYYEELYRSSFYNKVVDKNLQSQNLSTPTWDAYFFRIINIFNNNSDLTRLPGLQEIFDLIDVNHISRLKSTRDSVEVAIKIYNIIKDHIIKREDEDLNNQEVKVLEHVERQKNFTNACYRKKRVSKKQKQKITKITQSKFQVKSCKIDNKNNIYTIVTPRWDWFFKQSQPVYTKYVSRGINLGRKLLTDLRVRNLVKNDIFENQKKGKLDHKKLFKTPFNENIFYRTEKEKYKNTFLHISLDLSTSMRGGKLGESLQTAVAIAYAACNLNNFDVEITFRGTTPNDNIPLLAYAFNSKKQSVKELYKFSKVSCKGLTPEGICLNEVRKNLPKPNHSREIYLLNISDGLPNINNVKYTLTNALKHTSKVVKNIKSDGVGVLSYFVSDTFGNKYKEEAKENFIKMYGKDAKFIDINNISVVGKTINKLLLKNTYKVF